MVLWWTFGTVNFRYFVSSGLLSMLSRPRSSRYGKKNCRHTRRRAWIFRSRKDCFVHGIAPSLWFLDVRRGAASVLQTKAEDTGSAAGADLLATCRHAGRSTVVVIRQARCFVRKLQNEWFVACRATACRRRPFARSLSWTWQSGTVGLCSQDVLERRTLRHLR